MKNRFLPFTALLIIPFLSGCSSFGDLLTVKVDTPFNIDVPVNITSPEIKTGPYPFSGTQSFDLSTNQSVIDNKERIKDIALTSLSGQISSLTAPITLTGTTLTITGNGKTASWTFSSLDIQTGTDVPLANDAGQYAELTSMLNALSEVTATISGNSSATNVSYTLKLTLNAQLTVGL